MVHAINAFMESYTSNVSCSGYSSIGKEIELEDVKGDIDYAGLLEAVYDTQYGCAAVLSMTEATLVEEAAGRVSVNEGLITSAIEVVVDKVKDLAYKVKQFVKKVLKTIGDFFYSLYAKATPMDRLISAWGKESVTMADIADAKAEKDWKFPGTYWKVNDLGLDKVTSDKQVYEVFNMNELGLVVEKLSDDVTDKFGKWAYDLSKDNTGLNAGIDALKEDIKDAKEASKKFFQNINKFMEEEVANSMNVIPWTREPEKADQGLNETEWKTICKFAKTGQKMAIDYQRSAKVWAGKMETEIQSAVKEMSKAAKGQVDHGQNVNKIYDENQASAKKAAITRLTNVGLSAITTTVQIYMNDVNRGIIPIMKKQHSRAVSSYIYVQGSVSRIVKEKKRKEKNM